MKILAMTLLTMLPALLLAGLARSVYRRGAFTEIASWWRGASRPMKVASILFASIAICNADAFGYNWRSEVTNACISGTVTAYGYDEIGNSSMYTANCLNQYTDFAYDADGNMMTDGIFSFAYDGAGRLKTVASNGVVVVANDYDSKSRRVRKTTPEYVATYFYDDWNLIEERVASINGTSTVFRYYWGKDLSESLQGAGGVGGLLYLTVDGAVYVPCYDNNGNITCCLDETGAVVAEYIYDAFGNTESATGQLASLFRHRFSTKYLDSETGLYYYGYRFYHPQLMRWLTRDPIEERGDLNLYVYLSNSAVLQYDYLGRENASKTPDYASFVSWDAEVQYKTEYAAVLNPLLPFPRRGISYGATPQILPGSAPARRRRSVKRECPYFIARKLTIYATPRNGFNSKGIDAVYDERGKLRYEPFVAIVPYGAEPYDKWEGTWSDIRVLWQYEGKFAGSPGIKKHVDYFFNDTLSGIFQVYRRIKVYNEERTTIDLKVLTFSLVDESVGPTLERINK